MSVKIHEADVERASSPTLQIVGAFVAFGIVLAGIELLRYETSRTWGFGLVAAGAALGAAVVRGGVTSPYDRAPAPGPEPRARTLLPWIGVALAACCLAVADLRRLREALPTFGATEGIWVLSILLLALSTKFLPARRKMEGRRWTKIELALAVVIFLAGLAARVVHLREIPFAIHHDEIMTGEVARQNFFPWTGMTIFRTVWSGIDLPALWFALVAGSLKMFGMTLGALRLTAALVGSAVLVPFYMLARDLYGRWVALLAMALLATSAVNIYYARVTLNNITASFFWILCFLLLLRGFQKESPFCWTMAGLTGGLGEHFYYGTRLLPFLLGAFLLYLLVVHARRTLGVLRNAPLLILGYLAGFGPLVSHFLLNPGLYLGRGRGVIAWNRVPANFGDLMEMCRTLGPRLVVNALGVSTIAGNAYPPYSAPLLTAVEASWFALGLAVLLWRWRDPAAFLLIASVAGVIFVGGTLIPPQPAFHHWTPAFASFYAILAAPIAGWLAAGAQLRPAGRRAVFSGTALLVASTSVASLDLFFRRFPPLGPEYEVRAAQARFQAALGPGYRVRGVGATWQPYDSETNSYLITGQDGAQIHDPDRELPLSEVPGRGLAFFFFPDNERWLPRVRALYPGGMQLEVATREGVHLFLAYIVSPRELPQELWKFNRIVIRPVPAKATTKPP